MLSIVLERVKGILDYQKKMIQAQILSTLMYQFHSSEVLKAHSMWVCNLYFVARHALFTVLFFNGPQVNTNGILSFRARFTRYTPEGFPLTGNSSLIAPFWDDVDTRRFGNIYYRLSFNATLLQRARDQLQELFPSTGNFTPTQLFIATWDRVAEFGQNGSQVSVHMHNSMSAWLCC